MMIRFTKENWDRFRTHNKTTTIRTKPLKPGVYNAYGGSRYKPEKLGQIMIESVDSYPLLTLHDYDAENDGFDGITELIIELAHLNPKLKHIDRVYIHKVKVV